MTDRDRWGVPLELGDRRVLRPGRFRRLRTVGWLVAFVMLVALGFGLSVDVLGRVLPDGDVGGFLTRVAAVLVALVAYLLATRLVEDRRPRELAPRPALTGLLAGLTLGVAMMAAVMGIMAVTGLYDIEQQGWAPAWDSLGEAIQAGVFEELLMRGILFRLVWRAFGPTAAFVTSSVVFGASHLANPGASLFAGVCIALEAGVMFAALYALTGRLWVPIGVHVGWNFSQGYLFGAAVSGGEGGPSLLRSTADASAPAVLTGGAFGPEASVPSLVVCCAVGAVAVLLAYRAGRFRRPEPQPDTVERTEPETVAAP